MSSTRHRTPTRPRSPGQGPSLLDRLRQQSTQVSLAALAATVLLVFGVFVLAFSGGSDPADDGQPDAAGPPLPLVLESVGFVNGTTERSGDDEGPGAVSYCNRRPTADGLVAWSGNRLSAELSDQRVSQQVARFRSSLDADIYLSSNLDIIDCGRWVTNDHKLEFTVAEATPWAIYGDDTRVLELQKVADRNGPALFLRTVLVRSGRDVLQLTLISANQRHLAKLESFTELAVTELGY